MMLLGTVLWGALVLDLPRRAAADDMPFRERFGAYDGLSAGEMSEQCLGGDSFACLLNAASRILDETLQPEDIYGELAMTRAEDPEFTPRILVSDSARALRNAAVYLFLSKWWRRLDPGMIRDLMNSVESPYAETAYPWYLRRLADLGRMAEFVSEYRPTGDEGLMRLYFKEALKKGPEAAFDALKSFGAARFSDEFDEEIEASFSSAWGAKKKERRDYLLWRMYAHYRAFRYDRCLRVGKEFPPSDAARDITDWRAGLLRAMAHTRMRTHEDAVTIYGNLAKYLDRLELSEDDLYNFYRWSGYSYAALGRNDEAIAAYLAGAERLAVSEKADQFIYYAADMERLTENWQRAEELYLRIIAEYPTSSHRPLSTFLVFWIRYMQKRYDEAVAVLQEITQSNLRNSYDGVRARYWQARVDEKQGRAEAAVAAYAEIVEDQPFSYYGMLAASRLRLKNLGVAVPIRSAADLGVPSPADLLPQIQWALALYLIGEPARATAFLWLTRDMITGAGTPQDRYVAALLAQEAGSYDVAFVFIRSLPAVAEFTGPLMRLQYPLAYEEEVITHASLYGVSPLFAYAIMRQESLFNPQAVSVSNAVGLLQLLPGTAQLLADQEGYGGKVTTDRLKRPFTNTRFGIRFLGNLLRKYNGNFAFAAAAYNAGSGKVDRWIKRMQGLDLDEFVENIPIFQTRDYVKKVLANQAAYRFLYEGVLDDRFVFEMPSGSSSSQGAQGNF